MSPTSPTSLHSRPGRTSRGPLALTPLLACLLCLGLSACGASNGAKSASAGNATPQTAIVHAGELKSVRQLIHCLHQYGFNLPDPKSAGSVSLRGFDPTAPGYKAAVATCLKRVPPPTAP
jgi:hypothetical protein